MLQDAVTLLQSRGVETARLDAQLLLAHVLGVSREELLMRPEISLDASQQAAFESLVARRANHEPLAYIVGKREFWGMEFQVNAHTLIPRPDSETLITALLAHQPGRSHPLRLLDLGTGTGCLLLSALSEFPASSGLGVDISEQALEVARENAAQLGMANRAEFKNSHWNSNINGVWNVVLSNPPYIPSRDIAGLAPDVADYEPRTALDGGEGGLDCYRDIIGFLPDILAPEGLALFELGMGQDTAVAQMAEQAGLRVIDKVRDLAGIVRSLVITNKRTDE